MPACNIQITSFACETDILVPNNLLEVKRTELTVVHFHAKDAGCRDKAKRAAAEKKAEEKKAREEARLIERERKKADALEAKRYPMEDLQLLQEVSAKAASEGRTFSIFSLLIDILPHICQLEQNLLKSPLKGNVLRTSILFKQA